MHSFLSVIPFWSLTKTAWAVVLMLTCVVVSHSQIVQTINEYPVPTADGVPVFITPGPDGALWFLTAGNANDIERITIGGTVTVMGGVGTSYGGFGEITSGPDGALWFTDPGNNAIGRIPIGGGLTEYPVPTSNSSPFGITAGPDGTLWFAETNNQKIGQITTSGSITEYAVPGVPTRITSGPDGSLWFTEFNNSTIGRITTSGAVTEYAVPASPAGITAGPDGALWFLESGYVKNSVWRITVAGNLKHYRLAKNSYPLEITAGPDGALWFTETDKNEIGRITVAGKLTEYPVPSANSLPQSITVGPDGALWFTETESAGRIGQVVLASSLSPRSQFARPIPMGVSISNTPTLPDLTAGTAGLLVSSNSKPSQKFILSNNHVLGAIAPTNCPNTAATGKNGSWTLQPGTDDLGFDPGNNPTYQVGTVSQYIYLWQTGSGKTNVVDAAISLTSAREASSDILGIGKPTATIGTLARARES